MSNFVNKGWQIMLGWHLVLLMILHMSLVENYAQENHNWNQLDFFWPTWFAIAKQLQVYLFLDVIYTFNKVFDYLSNDTLHAPKFLKF